MAKTVRSYKQFTTMDILRMFRADISKTALFNYEERGLIPSARRVKRGTALYRLWSTEDLPMIGEAIGHLRRPSKPTVISVFALKGGTGKTTFAFQLARSFALHNIRTLVIGLDAQESISQTLNRTTLTTAPESNDARGLFHVLSGSCELEEVIVETDLPTLHYIQETIELSVLDRLLTNKRRKEYIVKERIVDTLRSTGKYDVIVFDCNPSWTDSVTGALAATDILVSPLGCEINSRKAANIFVDLLAEFQAEMQHEFEQFFIAPTLVENNKLSQQILAKYRIDYDELCTVASIRRTVVVQEANVLGCSLLECGSKTAVFGDFADMFVEINSAMLDDKADIAKAAS